MDPSPAARRLDFRLEADHALYRLDGVRRVVVDVEGAGCVRAPSDGAVGWEVDGILVVDGPPGHFQRSLRGVRRDGTPAAGEAAVWLGGRPASVSGTIDAGDRWEGTGWLVAADGPVRLDGAAVSAVSPDLPHPVFRLAEGSGLRVVPGDTAWVECDRFAIVDAADRRLRRWEVRNLSRPEILEAIDDGGSRAERSVAEALNTLAFDVDVPAGAVGLRLERWYDRFFGLQRARVLADGEPVGVWFDPHQDRRARWGWSAFGWAFGGPWSGGTLRVAIDPPAGAPLWSVAELRIGALLPAPPDAGSLRAVYSPA